MATGTITYYDAFRGFGFASVDGEDRSIFVHITSTIDRLAELERGQRVQFSEGFDARSGKACARDVKVIK